MLFDCMERSSCRTDVLENKKWIPEIAPILGSMLCVSQQAVICVNFQRCPPKCSVASISSSWDLLCSDLLSQGSKNAAVTVPGMFQRLM